jgi:hypothetical protein
MERGGHASIRREGFEPTIPVFELTSLKRAATAISINLYSLIIWGLEMGPLVATVPYRHGLFRSFTIITKTIIIHQRLLANALQGLSLAP